MTRTQCWIVLAIVALLLAGGFVGQVPRATAADAETWWSLRPLTQPAMPKLSAADAKWVRTPIDAFIIAKLREQGLSPSPEADRRTLIRRLCYDLVGLPPTPEQVEAFVKDNDPRAYDNLVERLLASPQYGERWARHWLDVVHYGDTHGYDKDKLRPNAWPYRDYVIRAFNEDKPYARFVQEQVAGDVLWPDTTDGVVATGFIAAGPWDFIGHAEVPESKIDGLVARHTDRDDMVRTVIETFNSTTVGCAQCHNHKFDPITMEDYYNLQAVFAAIDRADRDYEPNPEVAQQRRTLVAQQGEIQNQLAALSKRINESAGPELAKLETRIAELTKAQQANKSERPEFGYHSGIETRDDVAKWVQVDLGKPTKLDHIVIVACKDNFNNINEGFGFPVRFKIEASDDPTFKAGVATITDQTQADYANPKCVPQSFPAEGRTARYIRVTATKLVPRLATDYIFSLAELLALTPEGENAARGAAVTSLDSIEAPVRWRRTNLVDGYYFGVGANVDLTELTKLGEQRAAILARVMTDDIKAEQAKLNQSLADVSKSLKALPPVGRVYAGTVYTGSGAFRGRGGLGPREIHLLTRGQVTQPAAVSHPGTLRIIPGAPGVFDLPDNAPEGDRRIALAHWLTRKDNPLTWRSIVNRVWLYHFGRGIVDSPNDFGHMGQLPTHPELLDWLAASFRDGNQSLKDLHRLIVRSATYRQSSQGNANAETVDAGNRFLWHMNRHKLEAESIRDTVLLVAGKLDMKMGGPGFWDFVLEKPEHSPHYEYGKHDPDDPKSHRRSIYRFIVRSQPQPWMDTLDCADPSQMVGKRNDTLTALQALALLNNDFMLRMSEHMATRLAADHKDLPSQIDEAYRLTLGRAPTAEESSALVEYAQANGMANACRVIFNLNEFVFVD